MNNLKTKNAVNTAINLMSSHLAKILMICLFLFLGYSNIFALSGAGTQTNPYKIL